LGRSSSSPPAGRPGSPALDRPGDEKLRSSLRDITRREETTMPATIIGAVKTAVVNRVRALGRAVKRLLRPARPVATVTAGAARDAVRSRRELLAENALLRQQLIVLRRGVKRPAFGRADRLVMVLVARLSSAWREAVQVVQPDTLLRWHRDLFKIV